MLSTNIQVPKICDNENQVKKILLYRGSVIFVHCIQGTLANPHLEPCRPPPVGNSSEWNSSDVCCLLSVSRYTSLNPGTNSHYKQIKTNSLLCLKMSQVWSLKPCLGSSTPGSTWWSCFPAVRVSRRGVCWPLWAPNSSRVRVLRRVGAPKSFTGWLDIAAFLHCSFVHTWLVNFTSMLTYVTYLNHPWINVQNMQTQEEKETSPLNKEWECWAMLCKISYALRDVASHLPPSSLLCVLLYLCPIYLDIASGSTLARLEQSFLPHSTTTRRLDSSWKSSLVTADLQGWPSLKSNISCSSQVSSWIDRQRVLPVCSSPCPSSLRWTQLTRVFKNESQLQDYSAPWGATWRTACEWTSWASQPAARPPTLLWFEPFPAFPASTKCTRRPNGNANSGPSSKPSRRASSAAFSTVSSFSDKIISTWQGQFLSCTKKHQA